MSLGYGGVCRKALEDDRRGGRILQKQRRGDGETLPPELTIRRTARPWDIDQGHRTVPQPREPRAAPRADAYDTLDTSRNSGSARTQASAQARPRPTAAPTGSGERPSPPLRS